jgi:hypothetical protein
MATPTRAATTGAAKSKGRFERMGLMRVAWLSRRTNQTGTDRNLARTRGDLGGK